MQTERLTLRPFTRDDQTDMIVLLKNETIKKTYMIPDFTDESQAVTLFEKLMNRSLDDAHYVRGVFLKDKAIGFVNDVAIENGRVEIGYVIDPAHHNQGYCTEAVRAVIADLFGRGYTEVEAGAFPGNAASLRVMEKCGMKRIDKTERVAYRGKTYDCVFHAIRREE